MPSPHTACERCGRLVEARSGCRRHRGARLLDLRHPEDRTWRDEVVAMRRHRHLRMGTALAGAGGMVFALVALTDLVASGTAAHIYGEVGITWFLSHVLQVLSVGLVLVGVGWGGLGGLQTVRARRHLRDPIDRQAAGRELARRATALVSAGIFAVSVYVLRQYLIGVPAELVAAAAALVCTPPLLAAMERLATQPMPAVQDTDLLPPVADHTPVDTRTDDPLLRARRNTLRTTIMGRR